MTSLSRRGFLKLTIAAGIVAALPVKVFATIYCDGINCDADGFNALMRGETVYFKTPELAQSIRWEGDNLYLGGNRFTISKPIIMEHDPSKITINNGNFYNADGYEGPTLICKPNPEELLIPPIVDFGSATYTGTAYEGTYTFSCPFVFDPENIKIQIQWNPSN